jgi:hypothetical protein
MNALGLLKPQAMATAVYRLSGGEQRECVLQAQLCPPLREGHAGLGAEQPAQRALARARARAEFRHYCSGCSSRRQ